METTLLKELLARAFQEGFSASAEGFNGECAFDHLSPDNQSLEKTEGECVGRLSEEAAKVQWIAVSERLPEDKEQCLVARGEDVAIAWWHTRPNEFIHEDIDIAWTPTHWMPLPEPPEVS
jgi:hypothetical protein